ETTARGSRYATSVGGTLTARGGANSGDGGFIETSGTHLSIADNMHLDTLAPYGKAGTWLLDPKDFNIAVAGGDITGITLSHNLLAANVTISSSDGAIGSTGNIHVNTEVHWAGATTLTLNAVHDVLVDAAIIADTAGAKLVLIAGNDVAIAAPMTVVAAGSSIAINAGNDVRVGGAITSTAANSAVDIRAGHDVSTSAALKAIAADSAITIHAGNDLYVGAAITAGAATTVIELNAGRDVNVNAAIAASHCQ
ncbi:hypothetical protein JZU48_00425, partial [bacterium]|nr:hypothetical protein [bacterium]